MDFECWKLFNLTLIVSSYMYGKWNNFVTSLKPAASTNVQVRSSAFRQYFDEGEKKVRVVCTYTQTQVFKYLP